MAKKRKKKMSKQAQVLTIFGMLAAVVFLPTTALLFVGMMPTIVVLLADRSRGKVKAITVGAMNLAGCTYFLLDLWMTGQTFHKVTSIVSDPHAIVMMYAAAGVGYTIDWAMSHIVASTLFQRGVSRQDAIAKRQAELRERWGEEVTGAFTLDEFGFPVDKIR